MNDSPGNPGGLRVLVTDFDGTMTRVDFYRMAFDRLLDSAEARAAAENAWKGYWDGRLTHFEALRRIFEVVPPDEARIMQAARHMELDPELPRALDVLRRAGWAVVIASAGSEWYITRLLAGLGVRLTPSGNGGPKRAPSRPGDLILHANPGRLDPDSGLVLSMPPEDCPYRSESTGIDKDAVMRDALERYADVAYAGDGRPDLAPAMRVPPERRFATGWLAEHLRAQGDAFRPFERWSEIAFALADEFRGR